MKRSFLPGIVLIAAVGCYQAEPEVETTGQTGSTTARSSTTAAGTSGTTTGETASTTGGNPIQLACASIESTLSVLEPELTSCNIPIMLSLPEAECLTEVATCSPAELQDIQTFLTCVNAAPTVNCATDPAGELTLIGDLEPCESDLTNVSCLSLMGGTGGSNGGSVGSVTAAAASSTGGSGTTGTAASGTGGFGTIGTNTGGNGTGGFGTGGLPDGGRRSIPDGGFGTGGTPFCGSCTTDRACGGTNACIADGTGQDVCSLDCSGGALCPSGSTCQATTDVRGRSVTQCVPETCPDDDGGLSLPIDSGVFFPSDAG